MTAFPFASNDAVKLYMRISKLNPLALLEEMEGDHDSIVSVSAEGKKKQILAQTRNEVLERILSAV
jgi:hypothetical protein